jgi:dipeptidyl aminopeptidase/acylaminoacyl peptidase
MVLCGFTAVHAQAAGPIPAADFARGSQFGNPKLSPDGKYLAITARESDDKGDVHRLVIYRVADRQPASLLKMPHRQMPIDYEWASNTRLVVEKGRVAGSLGKPLYTGEVLGTDIDGKNQVFLYGRDPGGLSSIRAKVDDRGWGFVVGAPQPRNGHVWLRVVPWEAQGRSQLYDLDASSGARKLVADIGEPRLDFVMRNDGGVGYAIGVDAKANPVVWQGTGRDEWKQLAPATTDAYFKPIAFAAGDAEVYAYYSESGGPLALVRQHVQTGARTVLASDARANVVASQWAGTPRLPLAATVADGVPRVTYTDAAKPEAKLHAALAAKFPGAYVSLLNIATDNSAVLFSVASDRDPGSYYVFDAKAKSIVKLFAAQPWIDPARMAQRRPVRYAASDGVELDAFLTLPPGSDEKNLPLVLVPHGGPHGIVDTWFFDADAQFLASRGYAVLQVNFRGSGGRGPAFERSGYRQWGERIQRDLVDGVRWAIKAGHADASRVAIYGASFGGYSALMAPLREPGMFRCAVGYAGAYDLALLRDSPRTREDESLRAYFDAALGTDAAALAAASPVALADKVAIPVFIAHGEDDEVVPFRHAQSLRAALNKHGKPFEWMALPGEGHGFYSEANRTKFYGALAAFLDKHMQVAKAN